MRNEERLLGIGLGMNDLPQWSMQWRLYRPKRFHTCQQPAMVDVTDNGSDVARAAHNDYSVVCFSWCGTMSP